MTDPDRALVVDAQNGDRRAQESLYRRHVKMIYALALHNTRNPALAEEITQETFIRAFRGLGAFDHRSTFKTWLYAIAVNRVRSAKRRTTRESPLEEAGRELAVEAPETPAWQRKQLTAALGQLPEGYRQVVILHDVMGMDHEEIAVLRGCTVGTSKSQLHKARAKLQELLGKVLGARRADA